MATNGPHPPPAAATPQDPREAALRAGVQTVLHGLFLLHGVPAVQAAFEATMDALARLETNGPLPLAPHLAGLRDAARAASKAYGAAMGAGIVVADASATVNGKRVV